MHPPQLLATTFMVNQLLVPFKPGVYGPLKSWAPHTNYTPSLEKARHPGPREQPSL